jgi:hypothetical protein
MHGSVRRDEGWKAGDGRFEISATVMFSDPNACVDKSYIPLFEFAKRYFTNLNISAFLYPISPILPTLRKISDDEQIGPCY